MITYLPVLIEKRISIHGTKLLTFLPMYLCFQIGTAGRVCWYGEVHWNASLSQPESFSLPLSSVAEVSCPSAYRKLVWDLLSHIPATWNVT